jgi:hypothetical protein
MRRIHLRRPSAAMVVACIALTVALGGTSYAAVSQLIPNNAIGTPQLKDGSVTSIKVRDFTLRRWDFKRGDLPRGPIGPRGLPGVIGDLSREEASVAVPGNVAHDGTFATRAIQVKCRPRQQAIAGGTSWSTDKNEEELLTVYSRPLMDHGTPIGWRARGASDLGTDRVFSVQVLCAER